MPGAAEFTYQWKRGNTQTGDFSAINGQTASTYVLTNDDIGKWIKLTASYTGYQSVDSSASGPVASDDLTGSVSIAGFAQVGQILTAITTGLNGSGTLSYQWKRADNPRETFTDITGATASTYTPTAAELNKYIVVEVKRSDKSRSQTSSATSQVLAAMIPGGPGLYMGDNGSPLNIGGTSLAYALNWLWDSDNLTDGAIYTIKLGANEAIAHHQFSSGPGLTTGYTVKLEGLSSERIITLDGTNNTIFTVYGNKITLVLGEHITLQGGAANSSALVNVSSGGKLEMRNDAKITNNTSSSVIGGGVYINNGFLTMYDDTEISGNTAENGGGVYVYNGSFTMNDRAKIWGNTAARDFLPARGGGVYVQSGTFTLNGGTVYGSEVGASANELDGSAETKEGASLYVAGGTAKYGNGTNIISSGNFIDTTITR
ncbi:hypothetical protein FACS189485_07290 [Spirochaetia bacterium]|nr:hypothetical protein FACS189485_07290 [Spirochaetia bacterium]